MAAKWNEQCDVVVLGSGVAGLSTALAAAKHGLKTVLLEKAGQIGGGTSLSYALIWVGSNHLAKAAGITDKPEAVLEYMNFIGGGQAVAENLETLVRQSPAALKYFERCGIPFRLVKNVPDHYYGVAPGSLAFGRSVEADLISGHVLGRWRERVVRPDNTPYCTTAEEQVSWGGINTFSSWDKKLIEERRRNDVCGMGVGLVMHLLQQTLAAGVDVRVRQNTKEIVFKDGAATGVVLANGKTIGARAGVVIATGGYESNAKLVADYEGLPDWHSMFPDSIQGDGLVLGSRAGGAVHVIQNHLTLFLGFPVPIEGKAKREGFRLSGIIEMCSPHTLVVNRSGERFADESYFQTMGLKLRQFDTRRHDYPNLPCFMIFDQQYADRYSFAGRPTGAAIPDYVKRANTLTELGEALGIDGKGLLKTVRRFNGFVAKGRDEDYGRGMGKWGLAVEQRGAAPRSMGTLKKPPYYGLQLRPSASGSAGLLTNKHAQVLRHDRSVIKGLYSLGNAAAHVEYGVGYQAGLTIAGGLTFGLLAAKHMVKGR